MILDVFILGKEKWMHRVYIASLDFYSNIGLLDNEIWKKLESYDCGIKKEKRAGKLKILFGFMYGSGTNFLQSKGH